MPKSTLEEELAKQLGFAGGTVGMIREHHPYWCCEHRKTQHWHRAFPKFAACDDCASDGQWQHAYSHERAWRIDFAWPARKLAVEVEGGIWKQGRHTRGSGFKADTDKYNRLEADGWTVLRFEDSAINSGEALNVIMRQLGEDDGTRDRVQSDIYREASVQPTQNKRQDGVPLRLRRGRAR